LRQSPSPQPPVAAKPRSPSNGRRNYRQKNIGGLRQMIQTLRYRPGVCFATGYKVGLRSASGQRFGLPRRIFNLLENRFKLPGRSRNSPSLHQAKPWPPQNALVCLPEECHEGVR
jgi:hypothetical protein